MHIVYAIAPGGGPEAYVRTLAPWLTARGHRVSLICSVPLSAPFDGIVCIAGCTQLHYYLARFAGNYRAWALRLRAWEQAAAIARAARRIAAHGAVDLLELPEGLPLAPFARRWPLVVRAHGADWSFHHHCHDGNSTLDRHLIRAEAAQLRGADAVAPLSQDLAIHLSAFCRFPRERMRVVPYPIDMQQFRPCAQASTGSARAASAEPLILSIGRLEPRKGTPVLVQAMNHIWHQFPTARLHLLGDATQLTPAALRALVPTAKQAQLVFPGFVARAALPAYYRSASVYVTATRYETFGYTVLEALASGLPIVASNIGAIPELITEGENGLLVPRDDPRALGETITSLLSNPDRMARLGASAHESAYAYDLPHVGPQHEGLFAAALESHAHRTG